MTATPQPHTDLKGLARREAFTTPPPADLSDAEALLLLTSEEKNVALSRQAATIRRLTRQERDVRQELNNLRGARAALLGKLADQKDAARAQAARYEGMVAPEALAVGELLRLLWARLLEVVVRAVVGRREVGM